MSIFSGTGAIPRVSSRTSAAVSSSSSSSALAQRGIGMRDRAHTVSGPSPRRLGPGGGGAAASAAAAAGSGGSSGAASRHPSGVVRRGPDFLRSDSSVDPAKKASHVQERVTGISPQFVFLQLYHSSYFGSADCKDRPILLPPTMETSIKLPAQSN